RKRSPRGALVVLPTNCQAAWLTSLRPFHGIGCGTSFHARVLRRGSAPGTRRRPGARETPRRSLSRRSQAVRDSSIGSRIHILRQVSTCRRWFGHRPVSRDRSYRLILSSQPERDVLRLEISIEPLLPQLAADARLLHAAEGALRGGRHGVVD